ncbi:MAG: radical SAM protein [Acetobacteraceae bacterium]|nr:radical SAM protein [Acetobacteraceae bacterium]
MLASPFRPPAPALAAAKFRDPKRTAAGEPRATVSLSALRTLWFNTGTLCNITCQTCYIESSPTNDALIYLSAADVITYLEEIGRAALPTREIGFTGGEPFMNRDIIPMLEAALVRGFRVLVLTNAMRPMRRFEAELAGLVGRYGGRLTIRVSLDHHRPDIHEAERGPGTWDVAVAGLQFLASLGARLAIASRLLPGETQAAARAGFGHLLQELSIPLDSDDPERLVLFPEMDEAADTPEITEACWGILHKSPGSVMCASSRMVVHRRAEPGPRVVSCTLLPFDPQFDLGGTLAEASRPVALNHPHCARFCVLGGASCSA